MDTTKRKLSELIREGAKLRPQCSGAFFVERMYPSVGDELVTGSCALGAAYEAATGMANTDLDSVDLFNEQMDEYCELPPDAILDAVVDLNDNEGDTREEIADWLEREGY